MDKLRRGATRILEFIGIRERNLIDELNRIEHLFARTAYVHGRSVATTSNRKRLAVNNAEDGSKNKKQKSAEENARVRGRSEEEDKLHVTTNMSGESFNIEKWEEEDFFQFLASADEEILAIQSRGVDKDDVRNRLLGAFQDKPYDYRDNEPVLSGHLKERMKGMLLLTEEGMNWEDGIQRARTLPGRDNAIDHTVTRTVENGVIPPVGVEVKVPWNFPSGKVTSGDVDAARIGRDVSLVELVEGNAIGSYADYSVDHSKTDDGNLDVSEQLADDNSNRPTVARRVSARLQSQPQRDYNETGAAKTSKEIENGTYKMKHDVFPPRQLVSYMLSAGLPYAYLTTGYRIDFCKLVVDEETVTLKIAGPFWTVGKMHPYVSAFLNNPDGTKEDSQKEIRTSDVFDSIYYGGKGVRKFGQDRPMCFFRQNQDAGDPAIGLQAWSTNIGVYSCNEGLLRFLLAGTAYDTDTNTGLITPRHTAKLPSWYKQYANKDYLDSTMREDTSTSSSDSKDDSGYLSNSAGNVAGKTAFGRLSLADLQDPIRCEDNIQPFERLAGDADLVGFGRNGPAFRKKVRGTDLVCKQVAGIGCTLEAIEERILNLQFEMQCYKQMEKLQGTTIPQFLFAGKLVDTRFWVCSELGHVYGLATTWEGDSLDTEAGAENVFKLATRQTGQECDIRTRLFDLLSERLAEIHDANILHNDLELRNIVCNGQKVSLIDFDAAVICKMDMDYTEEQNAEKDQLQELVDVFWHSWGNLYQNWCQNNKCRHTV